MTLHYTAATFFVAKINCMNKKSARIKNNYLSLISKLLLLHWFFIVVLPLLLLPRSKFQFYPTFIVIIKGKSFIG